VLITSRRIEVPEQVGVRWNGKTTLTQHIETAKRQDGIWMQVNHLATIVVQDRNKKFAWGRPSPYIRCNSKQTMLV
jgi:hypothetical protein